MKNKCFKWISLFIAVISQDMHYPPLISIEVDKFDKH